MTAQVIPSLLAVEAAVAAADTPLTRMDAAYAAANFLREYGAQVRDALADSARLEALERLVLKEGGLVLHTGNFDGGYCGVAFGPAWPRMLRGALDECVVNHPALATHQEPRNED